MAHAHNNAVIARATKHVAYEQLLNYMAGCRSLKWENKFSEIKAVLGRLSSSDDEVKESLGQLEDVLLQCIKCGQDDMRDLCFSLGIVKALLGIMHSSSDVSMLMRAVSCTALLAHGNDEGRIQLGELKVIPTLLNLLLPHPVIHGVRGHGNGTTLWPKEWIPVYEKVLIALRKLTYHNSSNQQELAQIGGIKLIVELAMNNKLLSNFDEYPPEAKELLVSLVLGRKFITRVTAVPEEDKKVLFQSFPALSVFSTINMHYPAFYVDLVTKDKVWVANTLLERGVVWPDNASSPEGSKWTCVVVHSVEERCGLWCQFCTQNPSEALVQMKNTLAKLTPPDGKGSHVSDPIDGDVYVAYFAAPVVTPDQYVSPPCEQWFRVRILSVSEDRLSVQALAVDFGFTVTVPCTALYSLPFECRGIPPQAVPCKLQGISPLPASIPLLENFAAVIRNMAFEKLSFRKEIQTFKGTDAVIKLAQCPDRETVLQSLGALLNLTVVESLREDIGRRGAVKVALGLVEGLVEHSSDGYDGDVLESLLGLLLNCVTNCAENVHQLVELKGIAVLIRVKLDHTCTIPYEQRGRISSLLDGILSILSDSSPKRESKQVVKPLKSASSPGSSAPPLRTSLKSASSPGSSAPPLRTSLKSASSPGSSGPPPRTSTPHSASNTSKEDLYQVRLRANNERARSGPIICHLESDTENLTCDETHEDCTDSANHAPTTQQAQGGNVSGKVLVQGRSFFFHSQSSPRAFYEVDDITVFPSGRLKKSICALMNTGQGGSVYLGVNKQGIVRGCVITRKQRDMLCVGVDQLMTSSFTPPIQADQYTLCFYPVVMSTQSNRYNAVYKRFVVELILKKSEYSQIYTIKEGTPEGFSYNRCYYRTTVGLDEKLSFQELRDMVATKEVMEYTQEVEQLVRNIQDMAKAIVS